MAQTSVQPSGTDVSKVENDISQTITLADTIVTVIREPIAALYNNYQSSRRLKESLGLWQEEALDGNRQPRIPLLCQKLFEDYLVQIDGFVPAAQLAPQTKNRASLSWARVPALFRLIPEPRPRPELLPAGMACWAYFLFALGVHPGKGVTAWRPSNGFINTQNGHVEMEIEGPVLCHIINLFSTTLDPDPWARYGDEQLPNRRQTMHCNFPFGELAWTTHGTQLYAYFSPGSEEDLKSAKQPFGGNGEFIHPGTFMASYWNALHHGVSDQDYQLADPKTALPERMARLITCWKKLRRRCQDKQTLLVSYDWFENAARVKRRVLAQGGEDYSFYDDICAAIDTRPDIDPRRKERMKLETRNSFLLGDEGFTFSIPGAVSHSESHEEPYLEDLIEQTLLTYEHQPVGSWKHGLYDMRHEVLKILDISNDVLIAKEHRIQLLEFTPSCGVWKAKVCMGAPVQGLQRGESGV